MLSIVDVGVDSWKFSFNWSRVACCGVVNIRVHKTTVRGRLLCVKQLVNYWKEKISDGKYVRNKNESGK